MLHIICHMMGSKLLITTNRMSINLKQIKIANQSMSKVNGTQVPHLFFPINYNPKM